MPGRGGKPAGNQHRMELTKWSSVIVRGGSRQLRLQEGRPVLGRRTFFFVDLRKGVPTLGRRTHAFQHFRQGTVSVRESHCRSWGAGRSVHGTQRRSGEAGGSVRERESRSWVAGPIIYGPCARRVAQFARGRAGPGSPAPVFTALRRGGSISLREGVPGLGRRTHYLRHLREAGRSVCERQCRSGEAGRSVCERECRSWVAGPIIYGASARRLSQFARGSAGPGSPVPLFTALPGRSREGPAGVASGPRKHVTLAK